MWSVTIVNGEPNQDILRTEMISSSILVLFLPETDELNYIPKQRWHIDQRNSVQKQQTLHEWVQQTEHATPCAHKLVQEKRTETRPEASQD